MERRDLLRTLASATALTILPHKTLEAWSRVASGAPTTAGLSDTHMLLVRAIADTIIPRTDTPSATDVGVHRFVDVVFAEFLTDEERTRAVAGLSALDERAMSESRVVFADLSAEHKGKFIESLESGPRDTDLKRVYWQLKGLIVRGYFTSEPVMKNVLKHVVLPGRFEGSAPIAIARAKRHG
jgi:hypothetical protein